VLLTALLALDLTGAAPSLEPLRVADPPVVDGRLDDPAWAHAPASDHFTQTAPHPGRAPTERTTVRVVHDDADLYVGIECEQPGAPVDLRLTRRDREIPTDKVQVDLDTRGDGVSAFHFEVSAAGVLVDGIRYDDTSYSSSWDENWDAATEVGRQGWSAELRIPLRVLRFAPERRQTWGLQVRRVTAHRQETVAWAYIAPTEAGEVSRYGRLGPFAGLPRHGGLELRPFVAARARRRDPESGLIARGWDALGQAGLDAKWHVDQDLTLDLAVAPDFGQVEADEVVLNLGTFETFFEEKRPFFLEGLDVLATPIQLVYTRRIGAAAPWPVLRADARHRERLVDAPEPSPILAAGKLTGRLGRFGLGAVTAVTSESTVDVRTATGNTVERAVDPMSVFQVLRVRRELGDNAHVGLLAGATLRLEDGAYPIVSGRTDPSTARLCPDGTRTTAPGGGDCFRDAFVAGADARLRAGDWLGQGQVVGSLVSGGTAQPLLDGTVVSSGDAGLGGTVKVAKEGGTHWIGHVLYEAYGRRLALNDLGYLVRQNFHHLFATLIYQETEPRGPLLFSNLGLELFGHWNLDGLHGPRGVQLFALGKLRNQIFAYTEVHYRPASFDDRELGDGTALERAGLLGLELYVETSTSAPVTLEADATLQKLSNGEYLAGQVGATIRALPALDLYVAPSVAFTDGEPRFAFALAEEGGPLFGRQRAEKLAMTLRATWTFTPRLTLQLYGQAFLASVDYHDFQSGRPGARRIRLDDLAPSDAPAHEPDFQAADFNVSAVLRWEWTLGAVFWLVYSRAQSADPTFDPEVGPRLDAASLGDGRAVDVLLGKLSWWWG